MTASTIQIQKTNERPWLSPTKPILVGKDILELLSTSMYIDPMTVYREYVQNAADAIDEARCLGLFRKSTGRVSIDVDAANRIVRVRDNGTGIPRCHFAERLTACGASPKRGSGAARGFRGVGRLAGIGYCQELVFRSRSAGEARISELRWNCRKIKVNLRSGDFAGDLNDLVNQSVEAREIDGAGWPEHFFEVELRNIIRHRNDCLLDPSAIAEYIGQVAPVPFAPDFRFGEEIQSALDSVVALGNLEISVSGAQDRVLRPHRNQFEVTPGSVDDFNEIEFVRIPRLEGGTAALGWILHHSYKGAIPTRTKIKGLRIRAGNMQIGNSELLEELFPEPRFNGWSVGEIHIIDDRIVPNGRRDHFEQSVHYDNIVNHMSPVTRGIANRCRTSSQKRHWLREFERHETMTEQNMGMIKQGALASAKRRRLENEIETALLTMEKIACRETLANELNETLGPTISKLRRQFTNLRGKEFTPKPLGNLPTSQRRVYEHVFSLIYACSSNQAAAKILVDRILTRLETPRS